MIPAILAALGEASAGLGGAAELAGATGAAKGMGDAAKHLGQLESVTAKLNPSMQKFVGAITLLPNQLLQAKAAITTTFDTFVHGLAAPVDTVKQLGDLVSRFVRLSNPAAVSLFEYKVENAFASIGKILEPILSSLGQAADKTNVAMNKLAPALEPFVDATVEVVDLVGNSLVPVFRELAPVLKMAGENTHALVVGMEQVARLGLSIGGFTGITALLAGLEKLVGGFDENAGPSVAARPAHLSSIEAIQRDSAQRSLEATAAAQNKQNPKDTPEGLLKQILDVLRNLTKAKGWEAVGRAIGLAVRRHLPDLPRLPHGGPQDVLAIVNALRD